jgi:DNA-directed RNA polymerase specialized sigma24 family protein
MATDEQELLMGRPVGVSSEEIASHDEEVFARALLAAVRPALRALRAIGLSEDDAADVLQDASIRAWRHRSQRRGEFVAWFIAIAYHEARRPRRRWPAVPVFWQAQNSILDVASTLGISEPAAKQLLARARESLRRTLSSIPGGEP